MADTRWRLLRDLARSAVKGRIEAVPGGGREEGLAEGLAITSDGVAVQQRVVAGGAVIVVVHLVVHWLVFVSIQSEKR